MHFFCVTTHTTSCEAYSFMTAGYIWDLIIFSVYTNLGACHICTEGGQAQTSLHKRVDSEGQKKCFSLCSARGSNPGSSDLNPDALTTELHVSPVDCNLTTNTSIGITYCVARHICYSLCPYTCFLIYIILFSFFFLRSSIGLGGVCMCPF